MKYETTRERQEIGYRQFFDTNMKENSLNKSKKSTIKTYVALAIIIVVLFVYEPYRWLSITLACSVVVLPIAYKLFMAHTRKKSQNITLDTIEKVEHNFKEDYELTTYLADGKTSVNNFEYSSIFKIIENEEFFYIYLNAYMAIPLDKSSIADMDEFLNHLNENGVYVKRMNENNI